MSVTVASIRCMLLRGAAVLLLAGAPLFAQKVVVAKEGSGKISVLDSFSRTVTDTLAVPVVADPTAVAINPAGTLAAVYSNAAHRVDFYSLFYNGSTPPALSGSSVTLSGSFSFPGGIAFSKDGACVVVVHGPGTGEVSSVNVATRTEKTVVGGVGARAVVTLPGSVVGLPPGFQFAISDSVTEFFGEVIAADCTLSTDGTVTHGITNGNGAVFPNNQGILVADDAGAVHVFRFMGGGNTDIIVGGHPHSIAITPDGRHAYVYKRDGKLRLLFIDPFNNVTDSGLEITVPPSFLAPGPNRVATDGTTVFVSAASSATLTLVDVASFTIIGTVPVALVDEESGPFGIAFGGCPHHTVHGHIDTVPPGHHNGVVAGIHHGQHGHLVTVGAECPPHAPGHSPGLTGEEPAEGLFSGSMMEAPTFAAGLNQDGTLNGNPGAVSVPGAKVLPAHRGTVVQLFGSAEGLFLDQQDLRAAGGFTPPASGSPLFYTTSLPEVRIGGIAAQVLFSGLAPGLTGVWQINVLIPAGVSAGSAPVTISYEGDELTSVTLAIE